MIDGKLPAEVNTITLSYTFFDVGGQVGKAPAGEAVTAAATGRRLMADPVDHQADAKGASAQTAGS